MLGLSHSAVAGVSCKSSCRHGGRAGGAATDFLVLPSHPLPCVYNYSYS